MVTSVFPSAVFVQISNSLAVRQIRPRGVDEVEVFQINGLYRSSRQIWDGSAGKCMWIMKRCNFRLSVLVKLKSLVDYNLSLVDYNLTLGICANRDERGQD